VTGAATPTMTAGVRTILSDASFDARVQQSVGDAGVTFNYDIDANGIMDGSFLLADIHTPLSYTDVWWTV
jgi:hypothetical protein